MTNIKIMDESLANKIAAGEVVEKCLSVVKELVENSIDAGSTDIKIDLKESGINEIKVVDNGIGMNEEDALLCFQRHATSKLLDEDDLFNIHSLGFRGEALPSIASVSEIMMKTNQGESGINIHIKGGKIINKEPSDGRIGTSITVTNLFYNTPARLKYLKSPYQELANIIEYINKIALTYPHIKIRLTNNDKELLNTDGSGDLLKVINKIYGLDVTKKMIKVNGYNEDYEIEGYISMPEVTRSTRSHITTLVNKRVIRNNEINNCINDSYHSYKEDTRYPIVVLNFKCDPRLIDVNVHPSKLDIKFSNLEDLKILIKEIITSNINQKVLIPKVDTAPKRENNYQEMTLNITRNIYEPSEPYQVSPEITNQELNIINDEKEYIEEIQDEKKLPELYPLALAFGTYIICQNELGLYLIDQHAAKERINYEKYSYLLGHPDKKTTRSLIPIIIELPLNEFIIIKENIQILKNINIEIEEFGEKSFRIIEHPIWFPHNYEKEVIMKIFELIIQTKDNFSLSKFNDRLAMTVSCKMSIKANTDISVSEMESLINDLRRCQNPYNCPHGRPTIIEYTKYELERLFKRSI